MKLIGRAKATRPHGRLISSLSKFRVLGSRYIIAINMAPLGVRHKILCAGPTADLPRPRAAVSATVERSVRSLAASRNVTTARAWSSVRAAPTSAPAGCVTRTRLRVRVQGPGTSPPLAPGPACAQRPPARPPAVSRAPGTGSGFRVQERHHRARLVQRARSAHQRARRLCHAKTASTAGHWA